MEKMREEFKLYKNKDGEYFREQNKEGDLEECLFAVKKPNHAQQRDASFQYSKYMNQYLKEGIAPQIKMEEILKEQNIWDEKKVKEEKELIKVITDVDKKLKKGGIRESEAVSLAKTAIKARFDLLTLSAIRNNFLSNSAESLSQNHKFNYLVSECTVYSTNDKKVFKDYDDFLKQDNNGSILPLVSGEVFSRLIYNLEDDFRKDWPEYKFLKKYNHVNDKLQFMKNGEIVDMDGNKVEQLEEEVETQEEPEFLPD